MADFKPIQTIPTTKYGHRSSMSISRPPEWESGGSYGCLCQCTARVGNVTCSRISETGRIVHWKLTFHGKVPQIQKISLYLGWRKGTLLDSLCTCQNATGKYGFRRSRQMAG